MPKKGRGNGTTKLDETGIIMYTTINVMDGLRIECAFQKWQRNRRREK